jgi:hypothetical protein
MTAAQRQIATSGSIVDVLGYVEYQRFGDQFGYDAKTLANWRSAGKGPRFIKRGRTILTTLEWIKEWLESGSRS